MKEVKEIIFEIANPILNGVTTKEGLNDLITELS